MQGQSNKTQVPCLGICGLPELWRVGAQSPSMLYVAQPVFQKYKFSQQCRLIALYGSNPIFSF